MTHAEFVAWIHRLLLDIGFGAAGAILIVGAFRRWKWLVDPPLGLSPYYSQAKLKEMFGRTAVVYFTYFLGFVFFTLGCGMIYSEIHSYRLYSQPPPHWVRPSN